MKVVLTRKILIVGKGAVRYLDKEAFSNRLADSQTNSVLLYSANIRLRLNSKIEQFVDIVCAN